MGWLNNIPAGFYLVTNLIMALIVLVNWILRKAWEYKAVDRAKNERLLTMQLNDRIKEHAKEVQSLNLIIDCKDAVIRNLRKELDLPNPELAYRPVDNPGAATDESGHDLDFYKRMTKKYMTDLQKISSELKAAKASGEECSKLLAEWVANATKHFNELEWYKTMVKGAYPEVWVDLELRKRIQISEAHRMAAGKIGDPPAAEGQSTAVETAERQNAASC